ncbi:MAG: hypothetical protein HY816_07845 [Candidatus Wallbacteria bacterium]|nr:hypothetical protein [Candidatus Wallbacteria bacterium]
MEVETTPLCARCGEHAEPWPFACPECGRVHHARCWRLSGGCAACDCRTHTPRPEPGVPLSPARFQRLTRAYLRLVAFVQQRLRLPLSPRGLGLTLLAVLAVALALVLR